MRIAPYLFLMTWFSVVNVLANSPTVKVDFNVAGRTDAEVNELDYTPWVVPNNVEKDTLVQNGVTFVLSATNSTGGVGKLGNQWYKVGIQSPNYARLTSDCLWLYNGGGDIAGGAITFTISGLSTGTHTLLLYLNAVETPTRVFGNLNISINGSRVISDLVPTVRELNPYNAQSAFLTFDVVENTPTTITISSASTPSNATDRNIYINGFALNVSNINKQIRDPQPMNRNFHVDADNGTLPMSWTAAKNAVAHHLYIGNDSLSLYSATPTSPEFKGKLTTAQFLLTNLYSLHKYYWRVDEIDASNEITKGEVLTFKPRILAFPGAEGYGKYANGGRGGKVVYVTNLNDNGPGSLREAVTNDIGPRTIMFNVSGIITLQSRLTLSSDNVYIAGQTAPGKGICIRSAPFGCSGVDDCIMRFIRIRLGAGQTYDGTGLQGSDFSIFDHISTSWTIDESFSSRSGRNITLQRTMLAEALNIANHQNYPSGTKHGYAASISGDIGSFHHNLLAHNEGRNWSLAGGLDGAGYYAGKLDIFNNVVYNWGGRTTDGGAHQVNFVNNYYKKGAASTQKYALNAQWDGFPGTQTYYCAGNIVTEWYPNPALTRNGCTSDASNPAPWSTTPFFTSLATVHSAVEAYKHVLSDVGCTMPLFDDHDKRIITETLTGTCTYKGSRSNVAGLPDTQEDVGGYEDYPATTRPANYDTDKDGLPDWWETLRGLNKNSVVGDFSDTNNDADRNGYTELDDYLNWMATPYTELPANSTKAVTLADFTKGFTATPVYTIVKQPSNATITLSNGVATISPKVGASGISSFDFQVTDSEGATMVRSYGVRILDATSSVEIKEAMDDNVSIVNNPFHDNLVLNVQSNEASICTVVLYDLTGKLMLKNEFRISQNKEMISLSTSDIPSGVYVIRMKLNERDFAYRVVKR